jgi:hypothetical protein
MPRNPNLRINLEYKPGGWFWVLHKDSQAHHGHRPQPTALSAVEEATVLNSQIDFGNDRKKRLAKI